MFLNIACFIAKQYFLDLLIANKCLKSSYYVALLINIWNVLAIFITKQCFRSFRIFHFKQCLKFLAILMSNKFLNSFVTKQCY